MFCLLPHPFCSYRTSIVLIPVNALFVYLFIFLFVVVLLILFYSLLFSRFSYPLTLPFVSTKRNDARKMVFSWYTFTRSERNGNSESSRTVLLWLTTYIKMKRWAHTMKNARDDVRGSERVCVCVCVSLALNEHEWRHWIRFWMFIYSCDIITNSFHSYWLFTLNVIFNSHAKQQSKDNFKYLLFLALLFILSWAGRTISSRKRDEKKWQKQHQQ